MDNSNGTGYLFLQNPTFTSFFNTFETLLTAAVTLYDYSEVDPRLRAINSPSSQLLPEYDFIIVGAGSAGSVVANRLSEIGQWKILLLEAGPDESVVSDTPILAPNLRRTVYDWNYTSVYQPNVCQLLGGYCDMARGRGIGGSSVFNNFVWLRGNRRDYDGWAELGNPGWSYREVLPYFIRMEDNRDPFVRGSPYHGVNGPMTVSRSPYVTPLANLYIEAARELGYPNVDVDGESQVGFQNHRGPLRDGMRCSTGRGYIRPIRNRTNFHVAEGAFVTRLNIDSSTMTATGVSFMRNGEQHSINATKEVILSAGTTNSPQLLMLSGIGLLKHLNELDIPVIKNLSVGNNLHDHLGLTLLFSINTSLAITLNNSIEQLSSVVDYVVNQTGPLTSQIGVEAEGFFFNRYSAPMSGPPDSSIMIGSYWPTGNELFFTDQYFAHPTSRGTVRLANRDPFTPPVIDPQYLSTNEDLENSCATNKFPFLMVQTKALQRVGAQFAQSLMPECVYPGNVTDDFIICLLRHYGSTPYQLVGTCKMGPSSDSEAVVDARLRVHGVRGLRVVDASIMPFIPAANTNQPTIMIGERASDLIKEDYGAPTNPLPSIPASA